MPTKTLFITSIGSLLGHNILDALEGRRRHLRIVGGNSVAEAGGNFRADRIHLLPEAAAGPAHLAALSKVIEAETPDLVLAGRDDDVSALAPPPAPVAAANWRGAALRPMIFGQNRG